MVKNAVGGVGWGGGGGKVGNGDLKASQKSATVIWGISKVGNGDLGHLKSRQR